MAQQGAAWRTHLPFGRVHYSRSMADLFHFDIPTWGNYGDKALFPVVRDAFRAFDGEAAFASAAALRREVDSGLVERINARADAVVIGGGGLFLQDTNPNRLSGWQWKISAETLARIEVPLIVYAVGDNRFPGQPEFDDLLRTHVEQVREQSVFFGLRNSGSIASMSALLGPSAVPIDFQPCPTTLGGLLYEPLRGRRPDPREKTIAIQMLVHARQQAAGYDAEVIHRAVVDSARILVADGWRVLSVPFHPDDAEVSRRLRAEVPEVEEIRLWGADIGFFDGFTLFSSVPYVLGGRGHAQMIPFGVGSIPLSLDLHAKLGYFAHDIGHPEFVVPVGPEGMVGDPEERAAEAEETDGDGAGGAADTGDGSVGRRADALTERIVAAVMDAYARGAELQEDLAATRQRFWEVTRDNHRAIADALGESGRPRPAVRTRSADHVLAEEFHLAAVAESEEAGVAQTRALAQARREADAERKTLERVAAERDTAQAALQTAQSAFDEATAATRELAHERDGLRARAERAENDLRSLAGRTAKDEARSAMAKAAKGLRRRVRRLRRSR